MRILHCIPSISSLRGGPSVAALEMAYALRCRGHDVRILTTNDDGPSTSSSMPLKSWFEHQGVPVLAFNRITSPFKVINEFSLSPELNFWLSRNIRNYDLIHIHALFSWPSTSAMVQSRLAGVPYVISTIGQLNHWSLSQSRLRKSLFLGVVESSNIRKASALHFATNQELLEASRINHRVSPIVIPLGVHLPELPISLGHDTSGPVTFLFLSRIHPKKQLENLLHSLSLLRLRRPNSDWHLNIAGDGDYSYVSSLKLLAERLGVADRCHWLGFLEGSSKWQALSNADWFVLPSASENFGIAAVEALAAGTPVILSPQVAVSDSVSSASAGYVCSADPESLAVILERSLSRPSPIMKTAARFLAATEYSWDSIACQFESAYQSIICH